MQFVRQLSCPASEVDDAHVRASLDESEKIEKRLLSLVAKSEILIGIPHFVIPKPRRRRGIWAVGVPLFVRPPPGFLALYGARNDRLFQFKTAFITSA